MLSATLVAMLASVHVAALPSAAQPANAPAQGAPMATASGPAPATAPRRETPTDAKPWTQSDFRGFTYADVEGGVGYLNLQSLRIAASLAPGSAQASLFGPVAGVGAGVRLWVVSLGARYRRLMAGPLTFSTLGMEVGCRVPIGRFEPRFAMGIGTTSINEQANTDLNSGAELELHGYHFSLAFGTDYYLARVISLGFGVRSDLFGLSGMEFGRSAQNLTQQVHGMDGLSLGIVLSATAAATLHW